MSTHTYVRSNGQKVIRIIRSNSCDQGYCFRPGYTTIYCPDGAGMATPVLTFCRKHSGTDKTEVFSGCKEV